MLDEDLEVRNAEEKAIKEAEYIAASESIRLVQELSLRLELSEPNSKASSRTHTATNLDTKEIDNTSINENIENEKTSVNLEEEDNIEKKIEENNAEESEEHNDAISKNNSNENEEYKIDETKLILNEFSHDSTRFLQEQEENHDETLEDTEISIIEDENKEKEVEHDEINQEELQESKIENENELIESKNFTQYLCEVTESTKNGLNNIVLLKDNLFNTCKVNTHSIKNQMQQNTYEYLNSIHSKLIDLAGFHNPDECSICKDFRHQDVALLN